MSDDDARVDIMSGDDRRASPCLLATPQTVQLSYRFPHGKALEGTYPCCDYTKWRTLELQKQ